MTERSSFPPIRIIVVGCGGGRGAWFTRQLARHPAYQVVALVDRLPAAARLVAEGCGLGDAPIYAETPQALADVSCDAVLVATPDGEHTAPVLAALALGKHVYVEKPLAITWDDCQAIVRADAEAGQRTMVGFNLRFAPLYRRLHELIADGRRSGDGKRSNGAVGRVLTIQADEFYYGGRTYFRRWNRLRRYSGGLWITKASHDFDLLYWLAGAAPTRVSASARLTHYAPRPEAGQRCRDCPIEAQCPDSYLRDPDVQSDFRRQLDAIREAAGWPPADLCLYNSDKDTFDHGIAQVEFANDVLATYTVNVVAPFTDRRIRVGGSEGTLEGSLSSNELLLWRRRSVAGRHVLDPIDAPQRIPLTDALATGGHGGGDDFILDDFAAFVRGLPSQAIGPAEASVAIALGLAATRASDSGQSVAVNLT